MSFLLYLYFNNKLENEKIYTLILLLSFVLISPQSYSKKLNGKKRFAVSGNCNMCKNKIEEAALSSKV